MTAASTPVVEQFYERYDSIASGLLGAFVHSGPGARQAWPLVPKARLRRIWQDYAATGFVRDERGMQDIADLMLDNALRLAANTLLAGHEQEDPKEFADRLGFEWTPELDERFGDYILGDDGRWRLSDYAVKPLVELALKLFAEHRPEAQLQLVDRMLSITHARGDLAAMFVEGGSRFLSELSEWRGEAE